jgi:hypothetical protein
VQSKLLQYLPSFLIPYHKIKMAHGDANGLGEFLHLDFCGQVLSLGQGVGEGVYHPSLFEVFEDVPIEDGHVLVEADVSQESYFTTNFQPREKQCPKREKAIQQ